VNIPDCYQDSRFDPGFDKLTGYHTKSLLTMPIVDFENETMGVLQVLFRSRCGVAPACIVDSLIRSCLQV